MPHESYLYQTNERPDHGINANDADGMKDDNDRMSPSPAQQSKESAPLATDGDSQNPNAERTDSTSTSVGEKITGGIVGTKRILTSSSIQSSEGSALEDLSRRSTVEADKEPPEYKSISNSAIKFCQHAHSFLSVLDGTTNASFESKKEKLRRLIEDFESIAKDIQSTVEISNSPEASGRADILYRVRLIEQGKSDKFWYQDVPFSGVDLERIEPAEDEDISIFDVVIDIEGRSETDSIPPGETRKNWKGRKEIVFGKDISTTNQKLPAINIFSSHLLSALKDLITYYPSQAHDMSFVLHPYKMLLQQYPMIAAFRSTYTGPNEPISRDSIAPVDRVQHETVTKIQPFGPFIPVEGEVVPNDKIGANQTTLSSASLVASHGSAPGKPPSPEQKIQEILDLDTSLEVETGKPWKDHEFEKKCNKVTAHHIGVLLDYLAPAYHKEIVPELKYHKCGKASFKKLWILFQPGINVYGLVNGQYAGFVVLSCESLYPNKNSKKREDQVERVIVTVWNLAYAGDKIYRHPKRFIISNFEGLREITSLEVFPVECLDDDKETHKALQARGRKYFDIIRQTPAHRAYNGHTLEKGSKRVSNLVGVD